MNIFSYYLRHIYIVNNVNMSLSMQASSKTYCTANIQTCVCTYVDYNINRTMQKLRTIKKTHTHREHCNVVNI